MAGSQPLADRLWSRAERVPSGCMEWQGAQNRDGYGQIRRGRRHEGMLGAHRAAWEVAHGPIPEGLPVLHRCDNPPCVNPVHLFLGTNDDNMADKVAKGRQSHTRGESHGAAKLTDAQVAEIRDLYSQGWTQRRIASIFGCSQPHVSVLVNHLKRSAA